MRILVGHPSNFVETIGRMRVGTISIKPSGIGTRAPFFRI